ncbi:hypothetical protein KY358_03765 [Candidatus Woesearchaeota archaeon]|nr:hypothetical protein [Candidatus Woesearchaeota archaeon]
MLGGFRKVILYILLIVVISLSSTRPASSITIEELISSYDFTYSSERIDVTSISFYGNDTDHNSLYDLLVINITVDNKDGSYMFTGDLYHGGNMIATTSKAYWMYEGKNEVQLCYDARLLPEGKYNLSLRIQEDYLAVYMKEDAFSFYFDNDLYEKPDIGLEITSYSPIDTDSDLRDDLLRIYAEVTSASVESSWINALIGDSRTISSKKEYQLEEGINSIYIDFDGKEIRKKRIASPSLYLISIEDGRNYDFYFDYPLDYNLYDFDAKQSMLMDSYSDSGIDLDSNSLAEFLQINTSLDINESGTYVIEIELRGQSGEYITHASEEFTLGKGLQNISLMIDGTHIYSSRINGPYMIGFIRLIKDRVVLDHVSDAYSTESYSYGDFEKPELPDLAFGSLNISDEGIDAVIANEGQAYAWEFSLDLFDQGFNPIGGSLFDRLAPSSSVSISFDADTSDIERVYAFIDYSNKVEESLESNNMLMKDVISGITASFSLNKGWNLISFPLNLADKTLPAPLSSIEGGYTRILTYSEGRWIELKEGDRINETRGYWIDMGSSDTLEIQGTEFSAYNISLKPGWNLIGHPSMDEALIDETKINSSLVYSFNDSVWSSYYARRKESLNSIKRLLPGYGYWVRLVD